MILTYLKNNDIIYTTVTDNDHHVLGIINRFIRTLRDSYPSFSSKSKSKLQQWINAYNDSPHLSLKLHSPNDITPELESEYIKQKQQEMNEKLKHRVLYPVGLKVRIINVGTKFEKKRSRLSNQAYVIDGMVGK
jgi:hypothetical protein